jgi:hypothetical protein
MIFTVYCAGILYIDLNGGGTHISSVSKLQLLTKVSSISKFDSRSLTISVGRNHRNNISDDDDDAEDFSWHLLRADRY